MKLGIAREIITPKIGCNLMGYVPDSYSTTVNDDLVATVFYFQDGDKKALLISATVCIFKSSLSDQIRETLSKETGVPFQNIILCATHTHTGPNTYGGTGWGDVDWDYTNNILIPSLIKATKDAVKNPTDAEMGISYTESKAGINRRQLNDEGYVVFGQNPWGIFDPKMTVIAFRDLSGKPIANLIHYGAHSTCAGNHTEISRDWSGVMCDMLEKETGAITAFFTGPEGDVGPRLSNGLTVADISYIYEVGHIAGNDAIKAYKDIKTYKKDIPVKAESANLPLPLKKRDSLEFAKEQYENYKNDTVNVRGLMRAHAEDVIKSYENGYVEEETMPSYHSFLTLGDVAIVSTTYELFSEIGLRIQEHSPYPYTLTLALANGGDGYFPSQAELCHGGYEVNCYLYNRIQPPVDNADQHMMEQIVNKLKSIYKEEN